MYIHNRSECSSFRRRYLLTKLSQDKFNSLKAFTRTKLAYSTLKFARDQFYSMECHNLPRGTQAEDEYCSLSL